MFLKKTFTLFSLFLLLTQIHIHAQVAVTGKVVDSQTNEPLIEAQIMVGSEKGAVTDHNGIFSMSLNEGTYTALIKYLGYEDKTISINTNSPQKSVIKI